jgi:hypothetical protein
MRRSFSLSMLVAVLILWLGCQSTPQPSSDSSAAPGGGAQPATSSTGQTATTSTGRSGEQLAPRAGGNPSAANTAAPEFATVPAGEHIVIRLGETLSSKGNNTGDSFSGTVAQAISSNGKVIIPQGASAAGTVADAKALGRFKGGALLRIVLDSVTVNGKTYKVQTEAVSHVLKGKGKRSAVAIGGGAGLGALIGGLAGGGKGAAIGAAAGAGAGTAGAAFTGNKEIVLPAETAVSFKLLQPVEIR